MTEKRYQLIKNFGDYYLTNGEKHICYDLCSPTMAKENWNNVVNELNELHEEKEELIDALNQRTEQCDKLYEENQALKDKYERKDRQLKRTKKDIEKYTDYFMNELNWDCDRIIKEVFR